MREILFRGFHECENGDTIITINERKIKGIWIYGYYCFSPKRRGAFGQTVSELDFDIHYIVSPRGESYKVIPETVGQFTGQSDKNGKKIFESDIVKEYGEFIDYIDFERGSFVMRTKRVNREFVFQDFSQIEVIGNIYDNVEVIK